MITPRLLETYRSHIIPEMMKTFGYKNRLEVPKLSKIVINIGLGEAVQDIKFLETAASEIAMITGQKCCRMTARCWRAWQPVACNSGLVWRCC